MGKSTVTVVEIKVALNPFKIEGTMLTLGHLQRWATAYEELVKKLVAHPAVISVSGENEIK